MEIKEFKEMSPLQKKELYDFIKSMDLTYNKSYAEMTKIYESDTFNDGETVFTVFHNEKVKGIAALITKEISIKGEAFITDVYVEIDNAQRVLEILIETIVEYCNFCNTRSIKIGIREGETHLIPHISKLQFNHIYDAVIMKYKDHKDIPVKENKCIKLVPLSISNSKQYMDIHNQAFKNSPNGGTIDEVEVKDYIVRYANDEDLIGLCFCQEEPCGIYELSINGNVGWIDTIGIAPKYQKKGFGTILITECIKKLSEKNINEIKLLVITTNDVAMKMYKENRFEEEKVFSYWFEKIIIF